MWDKIGPRPPPALGSDGVKYMKKKVDGQVPDCAFDPEKGMVTMKATGCPNPYCDNVNCPGAPITYTLNVKTREIAIETTDDKPLDDVVATLLKSFQENPLRQLELSKRVVAVLKEEKAIHEKLTTAKPAEKKRLLKELDKTNADYAKLKDLMFRTAETGGWLGVPAEERFALIEKAKQADPKHVDAQACRAQAALDEYREIKAELESTSSQTKEKRLSKLLGRKEFKFDEAMQVNGSAVAFDSERDDGEELDDVFIRIACKALVASDEYLPKLLERKEIEVDEVTNDIAVIAGKQRDVAPALCENGTGTA
ncbi:hypothetical protein AAVH_19898 [Aphelenchoides avenae]|nr:hypothetical protein AAVH_19898 [Aphelenchus avenae]